MVKQVYFRKYHTKVECSLLYCSFDIMSLTPGNTYGWCTQIWFENINIDEQSAIIYNYLIIIKLDSVIVICPMGISRTPHVKAELSVAHACVWPSGSVTIRVRSVNIYHRPTTTWQVTSIADRSSVPFTAPTRAFDGKSCLLTCFKFTRINWDYLTFSMPSGCHICVPWHRLHTGACEVTIDLI